MAILSKGHKPDNFEPHDLLKLSFTNICSNFVECESFLKSNSPDILALCEPNLDDSINSGNFSVKGYLFLIQKDSVTHMHGLAVYVKEGLPFAQDLPLENSADFYTSFRLALLHCVLLLFLCCYVWLLILFHLTCMRFSQSTHLFVFGDFSTHHKDWLTHSGGTDNLVNSVIIFLSQTNLLR